MLQKLWAQSVAGCAAAAAAEGVRKEVKELPLSEGDSLASLPFVIVVDELVALKILAEYLAGEELHCHCSQDEADCRSRQAKSRVGLVFEIDCHLKAAQAAVEDAFQSRTEVPACSGLVSLAAVH